ncbi:MAG: hypothetical protein IJ785_06960 [Bacteroidales bacterium]|nr:hypothetical protein [Bacteroidales bacterium]
MATHFIVLSNNYEIIIDSLLSNWYIAVFVLIVVLVSAIPPFKDGVKTLFNMLKRKEREYRIEYADETITFDVKCQSKNFDIIKINATTHDLGVSAEYKWLRKYYPKYDSCMQMLFRKKLDNGDEVVFDKVDIAMEGKHLKTIWFDVTSFIDGAHVSFDEDIDSYAEHTINCIYNK